jgi:acyl dehydratase
MESKMSRYDDLLNFEFPEFEFTYGIRDTILYALGVGAGSDAAELPFVYEDGLAVLPTMAVILAYPGFWYRDLGPGLDFVKTVHASERFEIHQALPAAATVVARPRIVAVHDKGAERGALVVSERDIYQKGCGHRLATVTQTAFCRGDGGLGGPIVPPPQAHVVPGRPPDLVVTAQTDLRAALIYRLSGDYNPLHASPLFASAAGFARPILHGLSTFGHVGRNIVKAYGSISQCGLTSMACRFTSPVFPGDVLTMRFWREGNLLSFQALVDDRIVVDNGCAVIG